MRIIFLYWLLILADAVSAQSSVDQNRIHQLSPISITSEEFKLADLPDGRQPLVTIDSLPDSPHLELSAVIRVAAPPALVWDILVDCREALKYVPDIRECEVLQSGVDLQGNVFDITRHRIKPYFFLPGVNSIFRANYYRPHQIEFYRQGGDLEFFRGNWRFFEIDANETLLHYQATVDLHKRLSPQSELRTLRRNLPKMLKRLRRQAETADQE